MSKSRRLAWSLCAVGLALVALSLLLILLERSTAEEFPWQERVFSVVGFMGAPILGGLIASRRPENPIGWMWLAIGLGFSLASFAGNYAAYDLGILPAPRTVGTQVAGLGWTVAITIVPFLFLLFPTGRLPSRRWRFLAWTVIAAGTLALIVGPFRPGRSGFAPIENPFGLGGAVGEVIFILVQASVIMILVAVVLSVLSLVFRYRRAIGAERQQIKWFAYAAILFSSSIPLDLLGHALPGLWDALFETATLAGLYAAVGIAILRYRLYDIDRIINRTLVYAVLTAALILVYLGGVAATQSVFRLITEQQQQPQLAVVASTLVIAALFNPLRRRLQAFVDRRFYRKKYDAAMVLEAFSARLRDETDLDGLSTEMVSVLRATVRPAHASLWLRPSGGEPTWRGEEE